MCEWGKAIMKLFQKVLAVVASLSIVLTGCAQNTVVTQETVTATAIESIVINEEESIPLTGQPESTLEVHYIDVGQGDATLLMCDDESMLIDTGDASKGTYIQNYLQKRGITELKYLILTHPDTDHIGGAATVITKFDIENLFMSDFEKDNTVYRNLQDTISYYGLSWTTPTVGSTYTLGGATFVIVAPNKTYTTPNNASIGLLLSHGNNKFLFTGDAEESAEADMLKNGIPLSADVYKVEHHGSRTSTTDTFLHAVNPTFAVISCAEDNSYGHPHAETLNKLRSNGIQVFRTDEQGSLIAYSDGSTITWSAPPSESWKSGEPTGTQTNTSNQNIEETIDQNTNQNTNVQVATYILNTNTKKFHIPICSSVKQMAEKNKLESTQSREEIIASGYSPCKKCNP